MRRNVCHSAQLMLPSFYNSALYTAVFQNKNLIKAFLEKKIKEEKMEESLGLGKKSYGTETDTET